MIYRSLLTLKPAMLAVGVFLIVLHAVALFRGKETRAWLKSFPRSRELGVLLTLAAGTWFYFLVTMMDLGDFDTWRRVVRIGTPIAVLLAIVFVPDFLAVRALGMLALLVAEPLLEAAFLREEQVRLLLVVLVYVWIVAGICFVSLFTAP